MEEWLHCNQCSDRFSKQCRTFIITSCAHIFCSNCENQATNPVCVVCHRKCSCTQLNDKVDANVALYFKPPIELLKKGLDLLKKAEEVRKFQDNQLKMLRKSECAKFDQQQKLFEGAMQTIQFLKKENHEMKRTFLQNKSGMSISPTSSMMLKATSPDRSPRTSPGSSPRRKSPSHNHKCKTPPSFYSSVPCSPNKNYGDYRHHTSNLPHKSASEVKRVSIRSPPVDGKMYGHSPTISPNSGYTQKMAEGIVSKQATKISYPQVKSTPQMPSFMSYQSPKSFGTTPPSTPNCSVSRGYSSCPVTPEGKTPFYSAMQPRKY